MEVKDRELTKVEREVLEEALRDAKSLLPNNPLIQAQHNNLKKKADEINSQKINTLKTAYFSTAQIIEILTAYNKIQSSRLKEWEYSDDELKQSVREKLYCSKRLLDCFENLRYYFAITL